MKPINNKPDHVSLCLTDGDVICYRAAYATTDKPAYEAFDVVDQLMSHIISETVHFETDDCFKVYLTGKGNHRYNIAVTAEYKGNRKAKPKPENLQPARDYITQNYNTFITTGCEADDAIAMATVGQPPENTVIVSSDKDFKTIPCWLFDFTKSTWHYSTEEMALKFFYTQVLTGDSADNIKGLYKIGPKKAEAILEGCTTEEELFNAVLKAYQEHPETKDNALVRLIESGQLLHLQRYKGELWCPPK